MKSQLQKCIATNPVQRALGALLFAALLTVGNAAWAAQVAGVVARLSGPLMAKKADGSVKVLALKSEIESGDTLVSEKNTYAQIKFIDNSEITLRPGTTFKVENFSFDEGKPDADSASYSLVKGGLRSITGLMGKRNKEKFSLKTPNATIGIRGTTFVVQYVAPAAQEAAPKLPASGAPPALPPGLHLSVTDGAIIVTNNGGALGFQAGQFGYVPNANQAPVIVPPNTNLQFVPPPSFDAGAGGPLAGNGPAAGQGQGQGADCIVR
ncbi:FecR domain-containing protein [Massilia sp. IC2-476]|uniref:FecR family protein n=1 Tax=Massilia sp. IC2-476 TaxID=2887199 RepID=UPI001D106ECA|nr:FecR family protein [Massilia sp. IC2-476]MCC2970567.1 FecR family protein [Massilia sp. IC2-476]